MTHAARLRRSSDIAAVRAEGRAIRRGAFTARVRPSDGESTRLAVTASRALGHAVARNRARRRVREAFRRAVTSRMRPVDVVVTVRREALATDFGTLEHDARAVLSEGGA
jgi:ribonuclease P protein component